MNILCISNDLSIAPMSLRLKKEGHDVRLFALNDDQRNNLDQMIEKTDNWEKEIDWVGKEGLFIFDTTGYGKIQDELRKKGYSVIGGSDFGDKLEDGRQFGQEVLSACGAQIAPLINFSNGEEAIAFVQKNKGPWVIKQNGHGDKAFSYVGQCENGKDVEDVLRRYVKSKKSESDSIDLQKKISGVEIGVGRYFNGTDWVGPIEMNLEHKNLCNGNLGPQTYEMGTLMWYDADEKNRFFTDILAKLKPILIAGDFRGDVEVNCIVNEDGAFPLEFTARFGFPALQLQSELHLSPWGEFLKAVADGQTYDLQYKKGYGIVVLVATPPFPYAITSKEYSSLGVEIIFDGVTEEDFDHIHFEEVSLKKEDGRDIFYIASDSGFIMHVTGMGDTVEEAREKTYNLINKIIIPKMFYRTDIGEKFIQEDFAKLKKWGWLK
ncbi:MAG: phosphoribosylglycinamide synthetase C domain-containing protein [Parcubacteria group bacterium]|jgi:phosphoribosylamine--glycine ligase